MKYINIRYLSIILIVFTFFSCKKFLDEKSDKSLVVPRSLDDLQGLLDDNYIMNSLTAGFGETSTDDYFITADSYNSLEDYEQKAYTWRLERYNFGNDWNYAYNAVYNSNYCLDHIDKTEKTNENRAKWSNVKGSALFFRGFTFLNLCWDYAKAYDSSTAGNDLGIVLRLGSDFNVPSVRASIQQSYDQVIKDLSEAVLYLPDNQQNTMRPSKAAAYAVLARAYLSMRKYDSAYKYSNKALDIKQDLLDYNSAEIDPSADVPFQPFNKEIIFYSTQSGFYASKSTYYSFVDTLLYDSYDSNDLRKTVFFTTGAAYHSFKGSYASDNYIYFSGVATDELLLIRSECEARMNNEQDALNDLNLLLSNRWKTGTYMPISGVNASEALKRILEERRKELVMRGLRWIDIKRLNKEGANIVLKRIEGTETFTLAPNDSRYALAIPNDIILQTGIPQN